MSTYKSKTIATWLALLLGSLGVHRFYLYGLKDRLAWLHPWPTLVGLYGVQRMGELGQDDQLAWVLIPILGLMLSVSMLMGIVYGLTPDEKWNQAHNPGQPMRASNVELVRRSYRWAMTNPDTHDLFGRFETLCRWAQRQPDPHVVKIPQAKLEQQNAMKEAQ